MYKVKLVPKYNDTIVLGTFNWHKKVRDHVRPQYFSGDMIEWMFENILGDYMVDDGYIYFKNDEDALAFKLRWI